MPWQTQETEPWNHEQNPYSADRVRRGQAFKSAASQKRILADQESDVEPVKKSTIPPTPVPLPHPAFSPSVIFVVGSCLWSLHSYPRHHMAPPQGACGRGCAPVPKSIGGRGLSERSEFRSPNLRDRGKGTRRAPPGRPWFWVLLPKQKDLGVRGRNPAKLSLLYRRPCRRQAT